MPPVHTGPFENDQNILDMVYRGIHSQRSGIVTSQRQFEFSHLVLEECLWGTMGEESVNGREKKSKSFFQRKRKGECTLI